MKVFSIEEIEEYGICIVEEYVDGITLERYLQEKHTKQDRVHLIKEVLKSVDYIHSHQIIHRDIKPQNIIVLPDYQHIKLIDFGLADSNAYEILKQACGTDGYVSEEQRRGINDVRNDIFSLGCIMNEMHLGWQHRDVINLCLSSIDKRPKSAIELLALLEGVDKRKTIGLRTILLFCTILIGGVCWMTLSDKKSENFEEKSGQTIQKNTVDKVISIPSSPQKIIEHKDYTDILSDAKQMVDTDIRPINALMDTVTRIDYIPSSYYSFLEFESAKLNKYAESHRKMMQSSDYAQFYDDLITYYKTKTDRWKRKMETLNQ